MRTPWMTFALVFLITGCYAAFVFSGMRDESLDLVLVGAGSTPLIRDGDWYRAITATLLHLGYLHLALNCFAVLVVGGSLEGVAGSRFVLVAFVVSALIGNCLSFLWIGQPFLTVGASGGAYGLIGAWSWLVLREPVAIPPTIRPLPRWIVAVVVASTFVPLIENADHYVHIGGFLSGLVMGAAHFRASTWSVSLSSLRPHISVSYAATACAGILAIGVSMIMFNLATSGDQERGRLARTVISDARFSLSFVASVASNQLIVRKSQPDIWPLATDRLSGNDADHAHLYVASGLALLIGERSRALQLAMRAIDKAPISDVPDVSARLAFLESLGSTIANKSSKGCDERHFVEPGPDRPIALIRQPIELATVPTDSSGRELVETFSGATPFTKCLSTRIRTEFSAKFYREATSGLSGIGQLR